MLVIIDCASQHHLDHLHYYWCHSNNPPNSQHVQMPIINCQLILLQILPLHLKQKSDTRNKRKKEKTRTTMSEPNEMICVLLDFKDSKLLSVRTTKICKVHHQCCFHKFWFLVLLLVWVCTVRLRIMGTTTSWNCPMVRFRNSLLRSDSNSYWFL